MKHVVFVAGGYKWHRVLLTRQGLAGVVPCGIREPIGPACLVQARVVLSLHAWKHNADQWSYLVFLLGELGPLTNEEMSQRVEHGSNSLESTEYASPLVLLPTKSTILAGFPVAFCFLKMDGAGFRLVPTIYQRTPR